MKVSNSVPSGRQLPHYWHVFVGDYEHGDKALTFASRITSEPFEWQSWWVRNALAVDNNGVWVHSDNVLIVPRQNGKSWSVEVLILYKLFVLKENIVYTSHRWATSEQIYLRVLGIIDKRKSLSKRIVRKVCSQGKAEITLSCGGKVIFATRSNDAGRGFTNIDTLIYDEAYNLTEGEVAAWNYTQLASDNPQTFYISSSVDEDSHANGFVLSGMRRLGLGKSEGVFYSEWCAAEGMDRSLESTWQYCNPSYGVIQNRAKVEKLLRSANTPKLLRAFDVEVLGLGHWPELGNEASEPIIPVDEWSDKANVDPEVVGDHALAVDVSPDGENAAIVAASRLRNGGYYLSLSDLHRYDRVKVAGGIERAVSLNDPVAVGLDPKGEAGVLIKDLKNAEIDAETFSLPRVTSACALFMQLWKEGLIQHDGDPRWLESLVSADFREVSGGRAFTKKAGDITPLVAASFAVWLLREFEIPLRLPDRFRQSKGRRYPAPMIVKA